MNGYFGRLNRRTFLQVLGATGVAAYTNPAGSTVADRPLITRPIPTTGERLPVIGLGTARRFDVGDDPSQRSRLTRVLRRFFERGGAVIDSSPMYGSAEAVIGDLLVNTPNKSSLFAATKVWIDGRDAGIEQMERSRRLWGVARFDLMQIHNLRDWAVHIQTLKEWKDQGRIRYIGITTSHGRAHAELEQALRRERFDFVQLTYNIGERGVEERLLPLAADRGIATLINRPYRRGRLFDTVHGRPLPEWSAEFDCVSWGQFFLKFVVSHPATTCVIPATGDPRHVADNMEAGFGRLPDPDLRRRMIQYIDSL